MLQMLFLEGSLHISRYGKTRGFNISQYLGVSSFAVSTIAVCNVYIFRSLLFSHLFCLTRPKPAYGRQDLAGSWGQYTDEVSTFFGVLNVSLRACGDQLRFKSTWDH